MILIASGSEVEVAYKAYDRLREEGIDVRVVSMPSMALFEMQSPEYRESVLPKTARARVAIEAASTYGWDKYVGIDGAVIGMSGFGESGPAGELFKKFGFTVDNVVNTAKSIL